MKKIIFLLLCSSLFGCGVIYVSPTIKETQKATPNSAKVTVVSLTTSVAKQANSFKYTPKAIPRVFSHISNVSESSTRNTTAFEPLPPQVSDWKYKIGVADILLLAVSLPRSSGGDNAAVALGSEKIPQEYQVQSDGSVSIPKLGRIQVADLTMEAAEKKIFQALVDNQIIPTFSLSISQFNSQSVSIGGAVKSPLVTPLTLRGLFLDEAILLAKGIDVADVDDATVRLYRDGRIYQVPAQDLRVKRIQLINHDSIFVGPGDGLIEAKSFFEKQIVLQDLSGSSAALRAQALSELNAQFTFITAQASEERDNFKSKVEFDAVKRDYVYLAGEVGQQGRFVLPYGRQATLADAVFSKNGIKTTEGNPSQIYILRGNAFGDEVTAYHLDAQNAANLVVATTMELRPNDIVFVAAQPVTKWYRVLSQIVPSVITSVTAAATN